MKGMGGERGGPILLSGMIEITIAGLSLAQTRAFSWAREICVHRSENSKHENKSLKCSSNNDGFETWICCPVIFFLFISELNGQAAVCFGTGRCPFFCALHINPS